MEESNNSGELNGALLIGVVIGGVFGILFAPYKGSKTRQKIIKRSTRFMDIGKKKFDEFLKEIQQEVEIMKEETNEFLEMEPQNWRS
ncbi:MAG: YtxH domain-containing protein [Flavobacteriaceae bacterium]|nr:YtxH domain-containing protein [Flavobacteriaceae bacterium]